MGRIYVSGELREMLDAATLRSYSQDLHRGIAFREQNPRDQTDAALWELLAHLVRFSDLLAGALGLEQIGKLEGLLGSQGVLSPMMIAVYLFAAVKHRQNGKEDTRIPKWIREVAERLMDGDTEDRADPGNDVHG